MAKITRYNGNLQAFGINSVSADRRVFNDLATDSDDLTDNITADFLTGFRAAVPTVNDFPKIHDFQAIFFTHGQLIAYLHQVGISEWNTSQEYHLNSLVNYNGNTYKSLVNNNTGNQPDVSPSEWDNMDNSTNISYSGTLSSTNVKDALDEVSDSSNVSYSGTLDSTDVAAALDELDSEKVSIVNRLVEKSLWPTANSNITDPDHDVDFSTGKVNTLDGTILIDATTEMTKRIDAVWAAGDTNGGLFSGASLTADTAYHFFAIQKDSDGSVDFGFDDNKDCTNIPSGYTNFRRLGMLETDGSSNIKPFNQTGDMFLYRTQRQILVTTSPSTSGALLQVVPDGGIEVEAEIVVRFEHTAAAVLYLTYPESLNVAPSSNTTQTFLVTANSQDQNGPLRMQTNTNGEIRQRSTLGTVSDFDVMTRGWKDERIA